VDISRNKVSVKRSSTREAVVRNAKVQTNRVWSNCSLCDNFANSAKLETEKKNSKGLSLSQCGNAASLQCWRRRRHKLRAALGQAGLRFEPHSCNLSRNTNGRNTSLTP
jgi:hypothetical protein